MSQQRFVKAVAQHLAGRLHSGGGGYRCRCGACRHQVRQAARRSGIDPRRLVAALPPERPVEEEPRRRPRRSRLTGQVASSMRVARGRERVEGPAAVLAVVAPR